nr:integrase, catalytic region, zinc finger, CCHC-type, peptidase aspartic, catalytic [Tanacetum cinerariifolium]
MIQVRLKVLVRRIRTEKELILSIKRCVNIMKRLASLMKHQLHALYNRMVTLKDYVNLRLSSIISIGRGCGNRLLYPKLIHQLRHEKTPYVLLHNKLPDLSFLHVFGALCYPTNDSENLGKLQPADIGIFIGYVPTKKAFRIYNRRTRRIVETIHVDFDELTAMAFEQSNSGPALNEMTPATISSRLMQKSSSLTPYV